MRGGADEKVLLTETDLEDLEILSRIVKENIESTKNSKMPLI
jgi:hypothetical protein